MENTYQNTLKKGNLKLFTTYKSLSHDLLFYYVIDFLFLSFVKNIDISYILIAEVVYTVGRIIFQIPSVFLIDKIKSKKSIFLGNILISMAIFLLIISPNYIYILISQILYALGYTIKGIADNIFVYENLPKGKKRGELYTKIEGKAVSNYQVLYAVSSIAAGFLYTINPYIPMVTSFLISLYSSIYSLKFKSISKKQESLKMQETLKNEINKDLHMSLKTNICEELTQIKQGFKYIFKSKRLSILLVCYSIIYAFFTGFEVYKKSLLTYFNVSSNYFGIIFALISITAAISALRQNNIHKKYRNRTLTFLSMSFITCTFLIGIISLINMDITLKVVAIVILFLVQAYVKEPFFTLGNRYISNFSNSKIRTKIYSARDLLQNLSKTLLGLLGSLLITKVGVIYTIIGFSIIFFVIILFVLEKMKNRVGLKKEDYASEDIEYIV